MIDEYLEQSAIDISIADLADRCQRKKGNIFSLDVDWQYVVVVVFFIWRKEMISSSSLIESRLNSSTNRPDPDTEAKVRASIRAINETVQGNANEPSLAFYRIQVERTRDLIDDYSRI